MSYRPSGRIIRHLNNQFSPLSLWKGDGDRTDSVGGRTLSVFSGTERYSMLTPHVRGWYFDGSTILRAVADQALVLDGAMSFECLLTQTVFGAQGYAVVTAVGETLGTNYMMNPGTASNGTYTDFWENGAGNNITVTSQAGIPLGRPIHFAMTRSAPSGGLVTVKVYVDGVLLGTVSGVTAPAKDPTPANNTQQFSVGGDWNGGTTFKGILASAKIFNVELSAAQVLAESNYVRGR